MALGLLGWRARSSEKMQGRLEEMRDKMGTAEGKQQTLEEFNANKRRTISERDLERFSVRVTRGLADIDYFLRAPLGWREGTAVVWAGMRGAVTVAAAQTLPEDTPQRSVLVLVAFAVAALSLAVQGGTIGPLLRAIAPDVDEAAEKELTDAERTRMMELLRTASQSVPAPPPPDGTPGQEHFQASKQHRIAVLEAQRDALLDARSTGSFDADVLAYGLANLDAEQIAIEMRGGPAG